MEQIIKYTITDMLEVCQYIPFGTFIGAIFFCILLVFRKGVFGLKRKENISFGKSVAASLFVSYFVIFLEIVFFSRDAGKRIGVNLELFGTWGMDAQAHAYVIENILLFIPFGFFVPIVFSKCRNGMGVIFLGMLFSLCCEGIQFVTQRGYFQLDDIIMNVLGNGLGYVCYCLFLWE